VSVDDMKRVDDVQAAVRLGWYFAEVRGRNWWAGYRPGGVSLPVDGSNALPLRPERTAVESREQAQTALERLAVELNVNQLPPTPTDRVGTFDSQVAPLIAQLAKEMAALDAVTPDGPTADTAQTEQPADPTVSSLEAARDQTWAQFTKSMRDWDSLIQNELSSRYDELACGYLLGRGLAECYWALGPPDLQGTDAQPTACSWLFLFGQTRRTELSRLVGRVAPHYNPLTPTAISGSLQAWGSVVENSQWRNVEGAPNQLYEQLRRWYELLILGQDPSTMVRPYATFRTWRTTLRFVHAFWIQIVLGLLSVGLITGCITLIASHHQSPFVKAALGALGAIGLTSTAAIARLKTASQSLIARLRQDAYSDLVAIAITSVPPYPRGPLQPRSTGPIADLLHRRKAEQTVQKAVQSRRLTAATYPPQSMPMRARSR
jgi:hypothetical protein